MIGGRDNRDNGSDELSFEAFCSLVPDIVFPVLGGCVAFGTTLAVSTAVQKLAGISTATNVLPSMLGFGTVCGASLVSEKAAIMSHEMRKDPRKRNFGFVRHKIQNHFADTTAGIVDLPSQVRGRKRSEFKLPMHEIRVCLLGLLAFKSLGGRFWGISPSSYTHLGSFARWSIPCTENYANANQRTMIEQMGRKWGCHTCGSHMYFSSAKSGITGKSYRFVGDHMPPKSVAKHMNERWFRKFGLLPKVQFRFYPQCVSCSSKQGSVLSKAGSVIDMLPKNIRAATMKGAGGGNGAHFHGLTPRINHLAGGVLAASIVVKATDKEIANGNPKRFEAWHKRIEKRIRNTIERFQ